MTLSIERAARLGAVSREQIQAALDRFELGSFIAASPVPMGLGGQNIFIESTAGHFVLRGNPLFPGQFEKEHFFARLLHEQASIPVPWPYHHHPDTEIFGWPYVLMPRLTGINVLDPAIGAMLISADRESITVAIAETLASLHGIHWPHAGQYDADTDTIEPLLITFGQWITEQIWTKIHQCEEKSAALADTDLAWIESTLEGAEAALAEPFEPGFTMHDYWLPNLLFARDDSGWRVCGIFDFAEAYSGDGEADLARPLTVLLRRHPEVARTFLQRYLELRPPRPGFAERLAVYMLDDLLVGWGYVRRVGYLDGSQTFREINERFVCAAARLL